MRTRQDAMDEQVLRGLLDDAAAEVEPLSHDELSRLAHAASAATDREHVLQLGGPRRGSARRPSRPARWGLALAATLVLALLGGIGLGRQLAPVAESAEAPTLPPRAPAFAPAEGWTVVDAGLDTPPGTAGVLSANVPLEARDGPLDLAPGALIAELPEDGILVSVGARTVEDAGPAAAPGSSFRLEDAVATTIWEGAAGRERALGEYRLQGVRDGLDLDVRVFFGTAEPSAAQLAEAQGQLDRLLVRAAPAQVTITARPTLVRWAEPIALSGAISAARAGERVMIEVRECGTDYWRVHDIATTTSGGQWFAETSVGINASLRARWGDSSSAPVAVTTRPGVMLNMLNGPRIRISVVGARSFWRKEVVLQRFAPQRQRWVDVARTRVNESGGAGDFIWGQAYFPSRALAKGTLYRAVISNQQTGACFLGGFSNMARR